MFNSKVMELYEAKMEVYVGHQVISNFIQIKLGMFDNMTKLIPINTLKNVGQPSKCLSLSAYLLFY